MTHTPINQSSNLFYSCLQGAFEWLQESRKFQDSIWLMISVRCCHPPPHTHPRTHTYTHTQSSPVSHLVAQMAGLQICVTLNLWQFRQHKNMLTAGRPLQMLSLLNAFIWNHQLCTHDIIISERHFFVVCFFFNLTLYVLLDLASTKPYQYQADTPVVLEYLEIKPSTRKSPT